VVLFAPNFADLMFHYLCLAVFSAYGTPPALGFWFDAFVYVLAAYLLVALQNS